MNPVFITIGTFSLKWYSLLMLVSIIIGMYLIQKEVRKFNIKEDFIFNMVFWAIITGIIGARLYYVIFNWDYFSSNLSEIYQIWNGGLAIHGGIIAGVITMALYTKKYKAKLPRYIDFIVPSLSLAQAIARWGNFFNSEAHGAATTAAHLKKMFVPDFVINGMLIDGIYYTPTFFYESILCLVLFIILIILRKTKYIKVGSLSAVYLIGYGLIRILIESSRTDALLLNGFKVAQIVSFAMIIIGIIILTINKKKSKFEDLYNDKDNVDNILF